VQGGGSSPIQNILAECFLQVHNLSSFPVLGVKRYLCNGSSTLTAHSVKTG